MYYARKFKKTILAENHDHFLRNKFHAKNRRHAYQWRKIVKSIKHCLRHNALTDKLEKLKFIIKKSTKKQKCPKDKIHFLNSFKITRYLQDTDIDSDMGMSTVKGNVAHLQSKASERNQKDFSTLLCAISITIQTY